MKVIAGVKQIIYWGYQIEVGLILENQDGINLFNQDY